MIIVNTEQPRAFNKKYGPQLELDYLSNRKALINEELFFEWLEKLVCCNEATQIRKILLLVDNCSAHGKKGDISILQNVRVRFLPPHTTSRVEPLNVGIIAWVKAKYKRRLLLRFFGNLESRSKNIYSVAVLTAVRWTGREWKSCPADVVKNCFTHCFKYCDEDCFNLSSYNEDNTLESMARDSQ